MLQLCIATSELGIGLNKGVFNGRDRIGNVWLPFYLSLSLLDDKNKKIQWQLLLCTVTLCFC